MKVKTVEDLLVHSLSDVYSAEKQLARALTKLARSSSNADLVSVFETHKEETQGQIERIDQVVEQLGLRLKRVKCVAMEGLIEEAQEMIDAIDEGPVLDAALVAAAQKIEHYEIASYGTLATMTKQMGNEDATKLLLETLQEEKATDEKLSLLAKSVCNAEAMKKAG